ncbi:MAG: serine hydrolase domain-containing protein, partial [Gemmatimonadaceae bacterium]
VDPRTIFAIGSNSKAFTSTAIAMMVDSGRMHWDDHATKYLPGFQLYDPYVTREITVRDLLSHRSGLGRRGDLLWYGSPYSRAEILRRIRYLPPNSSFRSQFGYSNIMVLAAGQALAAAADTTWDDVIVQRIFTPLGMTSSSTSIAALARQNDVASPHLIEKGIARAIPWRNVDNIGPAGSINSDVLDMAQWIRLQLGNGTYAGRQLVSERSLQETHSPQTIISSPHDSLTPSTHFALYGMGWVLEDYRGREIVWHNGGIDGMLSEVRLVPQAQLGIVILTNAEGHNLNPALMYRIIDAYLGAPARDWSALYLARFKQAQAAQQAAEQKVLAARVTGT